MSLQSFEGACCSIHNYTNPTCMVFSSNETRVLMGYYRDTLYSGLYCARFFDLSSWKVHRLSTMGRPLVLHESSKGIIGSFVEMLWWPYNLFVILGGFIRNHLWIVIGPLKSFLFTSYIFRQYFADLYGNVLLRNLVNLLQFSYKGKYTERKD